MEETGAGVSGRAGAGDDHPQVFQPLAHQPQGVAQAGQHHHRRAVLVVVEDGDVQRLLQPLLDGEAAGGGDVLQIDATEGRGDGLYRRHDVVHPLAGQADGPGVHAPELLEQHRLALHHRQGRLGPQVAQPQHRRAVGDDGHRVGLDGVVPDAVGVAVDVATHPGHPRRVDGGQVLPGGQGDAVAHHDLAAPVQIEDAVADLVHPHVGQGGDGLHHQPGVLLVVHADGEVADDGAAPRLDDIDGADVAPRLADDGGHLAQHPRAVGVFGPDGDGVAVADHLPFPPTATSIAPATLY